MNRVEVEYNLKVGAYAKRFEEIDKLLDRLDYLSHCNISVKVSIDRSRSLDENDIPVEFWIPAKDLVNMVKHERDKVLQSYNEMIHGRQD